jgi:hypothetical protein
MGPIYPEIVKYILIEAAPMGEEMDKSVHGAPIYSMAKDIRARDSVVFDNIKFLEGIGMLRREGERTVTTDSGLEFLQPYCITRELQEELEKKAELARLGKGL